MSAESDPSDHNLHEIKIPAEQLVRGTDETVQLTAMTPLDLMPRFIAHRFAVDPDLRAQVYHYDQEPGDHFRSRVPAVNEGYAYHKLAQDRLKAGNVTGSLSAYRKSLHIPLFFAKLMHRGQDFMLHTAVELEVLDFKPYEPLEKDLEYAIADKDISYNAGRLALFAKEVRDNTTELDLVEQQWNNTPPSYWNQSADTLAARTELGRRHAELLARTHQYTRAALVSGRLGLTALQAEYESLRPLEPQRTAEEFRYKQDAIPPGYDDY